MEKSEYDLVNAWWFFAEMAWKKNSQCILHCEWEKTCCENKLTEI